VWSLLVTPCGHMRPLFGLILVVLRRSTSDLLIGVLTDLIRCLEHNDLKDTMVERL
jgi:hypothetical protein